MIRMMMHLFFFVSVICSMPIYAQEKREHENNNNSWVMTHPKKTCALVVSAGLVVGLVLYFKYFKKPAPVLQPKKPILKVLVGGGALTSVVTFTCNAISWLSDGLAGTWDPVKVVAKAVKNSSVLPYQSRDRVYNNDAPSKLTLLEQINYLFGGFPESNFDSDQDNKENSSDDEPDDEPDDEYSDASSNSDNRENKGIKVTSRQLDNFIIENKKPSSSNKYPGTQNTDFNNSGSSGSEYTSDDEENEDNILRTSASAAQPGFFKRMFGGWFGNVSDSDWEHDGDDESVEDTAEDESTDSDNDESDEYKDVEEIDEEAYEQWKEMREKNKSDMLWI